MRIRSDMRKYCQRNFRKKCDMYMIIIKIDCCGHPQMLCSLSVWTSSDAMQAKGLKTTPSNRNLEKQCKLMTLTAQSVKNKDTLIMDNIIENKVDACVVTETWLKEHDNIWISNSEFEKNNYIFKVAIYHPPYSNINKSTNGQFIDEFAEFLVDFLTEYSNVIIMGDFNIRLDNTEDPNVTAFIDSMSALGLDQHVHFSTHKNGGILDHIYTKLSASTKFYDVMNPSNPSDHKAVECVISIPNENITTKDITYMKATQD